MADGGAPACKQSTEQRRMTEQHGAMLGKNPILFKFKVEWLVTHDFFIFGPNKPN
jgi:hypothetical protein